MRPRAVTLHDVVYQLYRGSSCRRRMTAPAKHSVQMTPVPVIVVTQALPSRDSTPADMRAALDSVSTLSHTSFSSQQLTHSSCQILASGLRSMSHDDAVHDTVHSVVWSEYPRDPRRRSLLMWFATPFLDHLPTPPSSIASSAQ